MRRFEWFVHRVVTTRIGRIAAPIFLVVLLGACVMMMRSCSTPVPVSLAATTGTPSVGATGTQVLPVAVDPAEVATAFAIDLVTMDHTTTEDDYVASLAVYNLPGSIEFPLQGPRYLDCLLRECSITYEPTSTDVVPDDDNYLVRLRGYQVTAGTDTTNRDALDVDIYLRPIIDATGISGYQVTGYRFVDAAA